VEILSPEKRREMGLGPGFEIYERWFTTARVVGVVLVVLIISILSNIGLFPFDQFPIYVIAGTYLIGSLFLFFLRRNRSVRIWEVYLELLTDLLFLSAGIHYAGGTRGPFVFIYIATCVTATSISLPVTISISVLAGISYILLFYLEHTNVVPFLQLYTDAIQGGEIINGSVLILMISIIAFQSSYYISRIRKEDEKMLKHEEDLRKFKEDFLFKTVHDLRAPGTAIRLAVEELTTENSWACSTDAKHAEQTISIIQSLDQRMLDLVNDILKIGKSQNADIEIKKVPVDVHLVVEEATRNLRPIANARKMTIVHEEKTIPKILADKEKVTEVFFNLIDNGIKYNKDGGTVSITHAINGKNLEILITDQGVGIPAEDINKLFVPYFRSDTGKAIQGTGLGLYILLKI
jgi:signal transduction histidine kinase